MAGSRDPAARIGACRVHLAPIALLVLALLLGRAFAVASNRSIVPAGSGPVAAASEAAPAAHRAPLAAHVRHQMAVTLGPDAHNLAVG